MKWIVYSISPIDLGWENLRTVRETLSVIVQDNESYGLSDLGDINARGIMSFVDDWQTAKENARQAGWEGDFRHEPHVFWLPSEGAFEYGFVIKQDNNGTTFVISPQELPALEKASL